MRQRPRGRTHIARPRRIVLGFDPVDISEYATARDRPTLWEKRNNATAEILMNAYRSHVVSEGIGEQSKGELLSKLSAAFAPACLRRSKRVSSGCLSAPSRIVTWRGIEPLKHGVLC